VQTTTRIVPVDDVEIWAERMETGGDPVLLLTGAALQATAWESAFTDVLLGAGFDVVRLDWRDVGRSTWRRFKDHPYHAQTLVDDAAAVLDAFGIAQTHVVGFSMGGMMTQLLALRHPRRVRSLTLMASAFASSQGNGIATSGERGQALLEVLALPRPETNEAQVQRLVEQWRHLCGRAWPFVEAEWAARARGWVARGQNWSCPHFRLWADVIAEDRVEAFRRVATPALVIHGSDEAMWPVAHGEAIAAAFPASSLVVLRGRGHDIHFDAEIAGTVSAFLEDVSAA
jgi:pimeloyl-ACP methyl ester carboxylesterase